MCPDPSLQRSVLCIFLDLTLGQDIYLFVSYSFQNINFQEDWKIITLFIGGNDLCDVCDDPVGLQALTQDSPRKNFHPGSLKQCSWVGTWLVVRHGSSLGTKQTLKHCSVHKELTPPGQGDTDSPPSGVIELYPEEKAGVRTAVGFGMGVGVASEVYREQESLGCEHEKLCQAERGPAERALGT